MASALIQSNSQSALIATLNSAQGAQTNPFEYTLSKRIPSHGCQWTQLQPVNANATTAGSVLNFDLIKSAFTRSLTLKLEVQFPDTALGANVNLATPQTGFLNLIDHIDIESSSRRILTMSRAAMVAAYSDLSYEQRQAFARGSRMIRSSQHTRYHTNAASTTADPLTVHIPLLFSVFDNPGLALATGFTEPIRISIKFASDYDWLCGYDNAGGNLHASAGAKSVKPVASSDITIANARLVVEQRLLPNELEDRTISALYSAGPLSQLVYDYEQETDETLPNYINVNNAGPTISHEIRSTAVATDIYVWCEVLWSSLKETGNPSADSYQLLDAALVPMPLEKISFKASGQTIIDNVDAEYVGAFSKRTLKDGFFGAASGGGFELQASTTGDEQTADMANPCFVYRLQFGMDNSKQYDSNGISLRELNAPTVTVQLPATGSKYGRKINEKHVGTVNAPVPVVMHTIIRKLGLQTTDSSSGRVVSTLSN